MSHLHLDLIPAYFIAFLAGLSIVRRRPVAWGERRLGLLAGLGVLTLLLLLVDALSTAGFRPGGVRLPAIGAGLVVSGAVGLAVAGSIQGWVLAGHSDEVVWATIERVAASLRIPLQVDLPRADLTDLAAVVTMRRLPLGLLWVGVSGETKSPKIVLFRTVLRKFLVYGAPTYAQ